MNELYESRPNPSEGEPDGREPTPGEIGFWGKVVLTSFPFLLVLLFLILEWWIRGRS